MKKVTILIILSLFVIAPLLAVSLIAQAETYEVPLPGEVVQAAADSEAAAEDPVEVPPDVPSTPFTWKYLVTVGGCAVFVLMFVQATKGIVDQFFHIPTVLYSYIVAVATLILATAFTDGLNPSNVILALFNGWLAAYTAARSFESLKAVGEKIQAAKNPL